MVGGNSISEGVFCLIFLPDLVSFVDTTSISGVSPGGIAAGGLVLDAEKSGIVIAWVAGVAVAVEAEALFLGATAGVREALADDSKPGLV